MKRLLVLMLLIAVIFVFPVRLTILHVNDTHGHVWPFSEYQNPDIGGFAVIANIVEQIRQEVESEGGHVIFLHAGDINTGVPESDLLDAMPDIVALNMMKLDAVVLGNHEFDNEKDVLARQMKVATFPFLGANFNDPEGIVVPEPYVIKDFGDVKVAIFGLTTEETAILEPLYLNGATFSNAVEVSRTLVPELKEKADVVIALAHLGWGGSHEGDYTTSKELAEQVDGIDVIVDGHSHTKFSEAPVVNDTIVVQAWEWGKYVGRLDLDVENGEIVSWSWKTIPVNLKIYKGKDDAGKEIYEYVGTPFEKNFYVETVLDYFKSLGDEKLNTVVGHTKVLLLGERSEVRSKDTNLSNLICDAMKWKADADVAFTNGGGIRASIQEGDITIRDILTVLPFGNTLYVLKMTGSQMMEVLKYAASLPEGKGAFLHTAGLTWKSVNGEVMEVKVNGEPLQMDKTYVVVTNNYMASGGDGYSMFVDLPGYDTGFRLDDVVVEYVEKALGGMIESYDSELRYVRE